MLEVIGYLKRIMGIDRGDTDESPVKFEYGIAEAMNYGLTAGTTQSQVGGVALKFGVNVITTCANSGDASRLPLAEKGGRVSVLNTGANPARIYAGSGDKIDGGTLNSYITIPAGAKYDFVAQNTLNWVVSKAPIQWDYGQTTLDGTNPTPITHRLNQIVGIIPTFITDTAPGDDPVHVTWKISANVGNLYAWKNTGGTDPTLVASTNNTAVVGWLAYGY